MARIFLSHASADKPVVRRLRDALLRAGHLPWLDEDEILIGASIPGAVEQGLEEADYLLICLSNAAAKRGWVQAERHAMMMRQYRERRDRILPVRLEDVTPPTLLRHVAYVDLFPDEDAWNHGVTCLLKAITARET